MGVKAVDGCVSAAQSIVLSRSAKNCTTNSMNPETGMGLGLYVVLEASGYFTRAGLED
jgi:hypothetical protein